VLKLRLYYLQPCVGGVLRRPRDRQHPDRERRRRVPLHNPPPLVFGYLAAGRNNFSTIVVGPSVEREMAGCCIGI
jgi:hypothetical protein